jgi:hypothetical protein
VFLVARAQEQGVSLTGPDGLLKQLTRTGLETALNQDLTEHLGMSSPPPTPSPTTSAKPWPSSTTPPRVRTSLIKLGERPTGKRQHRTMHERTGP